MEQDTIRARRIELIDENGTTRAFLQAKSQGVSGLFVVSPEGSGMSATIGMYNGIPYLVLGGEGAGTVYASLNSHGPYVRVSDGKGKHKTFKV